jgi:membrane fusion protein (multidrug efflux system)
MKKIALLMILPFFILVGCKHKSVPKEEPKSVDVSVMKASNIPYVFDYPGVVQGVVDYQVIPRVSGAILKQYYKEGSYVKKDEVLYEIDPRPYQLSLATYQGNLVRDKAALDNYKLIYDRYVKLYKVNAVAKQDVETAEINYKSAVGNVQTDIANIDQQKLNIEYCQVKAPADGYISERQVTVGDMVSAFNSVLNQINSVNDMYILFSMPENDRLAIQKGKLDGSIKIPAAYKFKTDIQLSDGTMLKDQGYVEFADTRISLQNGVWNLRAFINNAQLKQKLLSGQFVHIYLNGAEFVNTFAVPQVAVFRDDKGPYVYEIDNNNMVVKTSVVTGKMVGDLWIINSGIKEGDKVVVNGGLKIKEGDKVVIDSNAKENTPTI